MFSSEDNFFMQQALLMAELAANNQEVPVGAVLVLDNQIIGKGANQPIATHDPTAHAEVVALRDAAKNISNYRLVNSTLYVTLEPCAMCVGAIVHARIKRVVYGAADPKTGAVDSMFELGKTDKFNHRVEYCGGLMAEECGGMLKKFFTEKRQKNKICN